jgi:hypothetical protein
MEEYTDNQQYNDFENPEPQRPTGLTIACVLSFINAGFQFLGNIFLFLAYNVMQGLGQDEDYLEMMEKFVPDIDEFEATMNAQLAVSRVSYLITALLFAASFVGVAYMWKLQKKGFHIYAIAQILILIATAVFVTSVTGDSIVTPAILTAIWIGIYFIYYRKTLQ